MALGVSCYRSERPPSLAFIALGAVLGLGFLTKGPIALIIPGLGLLCILWQRRRLPAISRPALILSAILFLVFSLGWFAVVYFRMGIDPIKFFFVRENLQRFSGAAHDVGRPFWFYIATYLGQGAPWSFLMPLAALQFLRSEGDEGGKILILWILLVVGLLTLSHGKVDYYLLPLYPAAALLVGRYLQVAVWTRGQRLFIAMLLGVVGTGLILLPLPILRVPSEWRPAGFAMFGVTVALIIGAVACFGATFRLKPAIALRAFSLSVWLASGVVSVFLLPSFYAGQPNDVLIAAASRERMLRPDLTVAAHEDPTQLHRDLLFYSRLVVEESADLSSLASSPKPYLILASPGEAASLKETTRVREIGTYRYIPLKFFTLSGIWAQPEPEQLVLLANFDF